MKTLQETFDFVIDKIVGQGGQCNDSQGNCVYGDDEGNHCAIGWLLDPDDDVLMGWAGSVHQIIDDFPEALPDVVKSNIDLFNVIQEFHDMPSLESRYSILSRLETTYNINISNPNVQKWIDMGV